MFPSLIIFYTHQCFQVQSGQLINQHCSHQWKSETCDNTPQVCKAYSIVQFHLDGGMANSLWSKSNIMGHKQNNIHYSQMLPMINK